MDCVVPQWSFEEESWEDFFPSISFTSDLKEIPEHLVEDHSDDSWMETLSCEPLQGVVITDEVITDALMSGNEDLGIYLNEGSTPSEGHHSLMSDDIIANAFAAATKDEEDLGINLDIPDGATYSHRTPSPISSATSGFLSTSDCEALSPGSLGSPSSPYVFGVNETEYHNTEVGSIPPYQALQDHLYQQKQLQEPAPVPMVTTPVDRHLQKWLTTQMESSQGKAKSSNHSNRKPPESYLTLIAKAILSLPTRRALLSDIYKFSLDNYEYYHTANGTWKNAIRHNLSVNECFIKNGRAPHGRGYYWAVHPACLKTFMKGDFRRREAQLLATESDRLQQGATQYYHVYHHTMSYHDK